MKYIRYREGYKYQLTETYVDVIGIIPARPINTQFISLDLDGRLEICAGYAWDGASGPTIDTKDSMRASLVHDALYQLMRLELLDRTVHRQLADDIFYRMCREDGMWPPRAGIWYTIVSNFADAAADPASVTPDLIAPDSSRAEAPELEAP